MNTNRCEMLEIIDDVSGAVIGIAPRKKCHGDPTLIHRSVHVVVYASNGDILLQKRKMTKDIQPGKWDTACGGHLDPGDTFETAAVRELSEELGLVLPPEKFRYLFDYKVRNAIESENVRVFAITSDGPFFPQESELDGVQFYPAETLKNRLFSGNTDDLTPLLCSELKILFGLDDGSGQYG